MRSPGGGELSLSACPGVGNRPPSEKKIANPRGYARGGMVTGRIEPCITRYFSFPLGIRVIGSQLFGQRRDCARVIGERLRDSYCR